MLLNSIYFDNKNGHLVLPADGLYYVYVLKCKCTGYYYFGYTNNVARRFKQHIKSIVSAADKGPTMKTQLVHRKMSEGIKKAINRRRKEYCTKDITAENISMKVLGICTDQQSAMAMEWGYILFFKGNRNCINEFTRVPKLLKKKERNAAVHLSGEP